MDVGVAGLDRLAGASSDISKSAAQSLLNTTGDQRGDVRRSTDLCCGATGRWHVGWEPRRSSSELWPGSQSQLCRKNLLKEKEEDNISLT